MNATTAQQFERMFNVTEDEATGAKALGHILNITATVVSLVLAFSVSSFWLGLLIWFISSILLGVLAVITAIYFCMAHADKVEALGRTVNNTSDAVRGAASKVRGWFSR
jgi:uncharacterized protein YacL